MYIQAVPTKGGRSNPFSYRPLDLISCASEASETILITNIFKYPSLPNLPYDRQQMFRKDRSTDDLTFLTESRVFSLRSFSETFAIALDLDISKAIDSLV